MPIMLDPGNSGGGSPDITYSPQLVEITPPRLGNNTVVDWANRVIDYYLGKDSSYSVFERNAFAHAMTSAYLTYKYGSNFAKENGNLKEEINGNLDKLGSLFDPQKQWELKQDTRKDYANNVWGRYRGDTFKNEGRSIFDLGWQIKQDLDDGLLIVSYNDDRISDQAFEGFEPYPLSDAVRALEVVLRTSAKIIFDKLHDYFDDGEGMEPGPDPLILDLDGDGIETTNLDNGILFDLDVNDFEEQTSWIDKDDGILVLDINNNNQIDNARELFGDQARLENGLLANNGFSALKDLDDNLDGKIDSNDSAFAQLKVLKGDGNAYTLNEIGIESLNLSYQDTNVIDKSGNTQIRLGSYKLSSGEILDMADYSFVVDTAHSKAIEFVNVPNAIALLPNMEGNGNVLSLHQAMVQDTSGVLKSLVESFISETAPVQRQQIFDQILLKWTGSDTLSPNGRGNHMDMRWLHVLEEFMGESFKNNFTSVVSVAMAEVLTKALQGLKEMLYSQLMVQTHAEQWISLIEFDVNPEQTDFTLSLDSVISELQTLINTDLEEGKTELSEISRVLKASNIENISNYQEFYDHFSALGDEYKWILDTASLNRVDGTNSNDTLYGSSTDDVIYGNDGSDLIINTSNPFADERGNDFISGGNGNDAIYAGTGNDFLKGDDGNDMLYAQDGNDTAEGGLGNDVLYGAAGNDILRGNDGDDRLWGDTGKDSLEGGAGNDELRGQADNDVLTGGTGNDTILGGTGDDQYVFNSGDGTDVLIEGYSASDRGGSDTLKFGTGITQANLTLSSVVQNTFVANDLQIGITGSSDKITIRGELNTDSSSWIEKIEFADASNLTRDQILALLENQGTSGNDLKCDKKDCNFEPLQLSYTTKNK